jgi:hypothetical protein
LTKAVRIKPLRRLLDPSEGIRLGFSCNPSSWVIPGVQDYDMLVFKEY